jgi:RNA polymerase sigma factor (sigma-70 family)
MKVTDPISDVDLLGLLSRDVSAFETFYRRYMRRVTAFAARRCSSAEDVADVVAQTFVRLLDVADRYDPERGEPAAFLFAIAGSAVRDLHRHAERRQALVAKLSGRDLLDDDDTERITAAIDASREASAVHAALDDMPAAEQAMLRLVADGHSPGEAAAELGISPGAGWTRLSRARQRLRRRVSHPRRSES